MTPPKMTVQPRRISTLIAIVPLLLVIGCQSNRPWPKLAKGYIDANQDGIRELYEYVEPTDQFSPDDSIIFINRIIRDRTGERLNMIVWGPDRQTMVARESSPIIEPFQVTHHRHSARDFVEQAGTGSYLVNWRIGDDTIEAYNFDILEGAGLPPIDLEFPESQPMDLDDFSPDGTMGIRG